VAGESDAMTKTVDVPDAKIRDAVGTTKLHYEIGFVQRFLPSG